MSQMGNTLPSVNVEPVPPVVLPEATVVLKMKESDARILATLLYRFNFSPDVVAHLSEEYTAVRAREKHYGRRLNVIYEQLATAGYPTLVPAFVHGEVVR